MTSKKYFFILMLIAWVCIHAPVYAVSISASSVISNWTRATSPVSGATDSWTTSGTAVYYTTNNGSSIISNFTASGDFDFSTRIWNSGDNDRYGVVFGWQNVDNHYRMSWEGGGQADGTFRGLQLIREVNGVATALYTSSGYWANATQYDVKVFRTGSNVGMYITRVSDGAVMANVSVADNNFTSGKVGLWNSSQVTYYDNLQYNDNYAALGVSNTNFGNVRVGTSATATVTVTNTGSGSSTLTGTTGAASGSEFSPTSGTQSFTLGQNQQNTRTYTYTPSAQGSDSTTISVSSNAGSATRTLTGTGVSPVFSSSVAVGSTINFGEVGYIEDRTLSVQNITTDANLGNLTDMTLLSATITGPDASYFTLENFTPGTKLSKSQLENLAIRFMHNYGGRDDYGYVRNATLTLTTDVGAALGVNGQSYSFALQATTIPEISTLSMFAFSLLFAFFLRKKH